MGNNQDPASKGVPSESSDALVTSTNLQAAPVTDDETAAADVMVGAESADLISLSDFIKDPANSVTIPVDMVEGAIKNLDFSEETVGAFRLATSELGLGKALILGIQKQLGIVCFRRDEDDSYHFVNVDGKYSGSRPELAKELLEKCGFTYATEVGYMVGQALSTLMQQSNRIKEQATK